jgi:hypothetical protein
MTVVLVAVAVAPAAHAARGLTLGFSADSSLAGASASSDTRWATRAVDEGARVVRVNVIWSEVAPAKRPLGFAADNPASRGYDWSAVDTPVRILAAHGLQVLLTVYGAPRWAEGRGRPASAPPGSWKPDPTQFALFAKAAAIRYDGHFPDPRRPGATLPRVQHWQALNEPNLIYYISPQWKRTRTGFRPASPEIYRGLLNAFYRAVKRVDRSNFVLMAGTAPYGDPPGGKRMRPLLFYRELFCLTVRLRPQRCPAPAHLDALDHHPYSSRPTYRAYWSDDVAIVDVYKITRVLRAAERMRHVLPRGKKPLWVTEVAWNTNPPYAYGTPLMEHARWTVQALYLLWRQGVSTVMALHIVDAASRAPDYPYAYGWDGLFYSNGQPKPAATAFQFPFMTHRSNRRTISVWGRAPAAGLLLIERLQGAGWAVRARVTVRARQVFTRRLFLRGGALLRAQVAGQTSLIWNQRG